MYVCDFLNEFKKLGFSFWHEKTAENCNILILRNKKSKKGVRATKKDNKIVDFIIFHYKEV